jgi:DNA-binding NarL/FixJ family response regulator
VGRGGLRVVLVDDFAPIRALLGELLAERGCEIVGEAGDGDEAIAMLAHLDCDLVVMDFQMPMVDGVTATARIVARDPNVKVVAFSSADDDVVAQRFLDAGAVAHFSKGDVGKLAHYVGSMALVARERARRAG